MLDLTAGYLVNITKIYKNQRVKKVSRKVMLPLDKARHLGSLLERDLGTFLPIGQGIEKKETFRCLPEVGITYEMHLIAAEGQTMPTITLEVQDSRKVIPLLEAAIHRQIAYVAIGIEKTRKRIEDFEQKYGCRLAEADKVALALDPLERVEWEGEAEMLQRLETERQLLETVRVCG